MRIEPLAEAHDPVFYAAGTHPMSAADEPLATVDDLTVLAAHPGIEPAWADAFARWATVRVLGTDEHSLGLLADRRDRWNEGLAAADARLAAGNALWFAWLDEAITASAR